MPAGVAPATSADTYCRAARRLRCRYASRPAELHRALKSLADEPMTVKPRQTPVGSAGFAEHVAASLTSNVLRYSQRLQLIRDAQRFRISRFEANLVIAAVMGRRRNGAVELTEPSDRSVLTGVTTFLLVQGALALGAWWVLLR
jgi:hypothetical protein